jgi:predicted enzyme related to lactoylglutathione lyase
MKKLSKHVTGLFFAVLLSALAAFSVSAQQGPGSADSSVRAGTEITPAIAQRLSFITIGAKDLNKLKQFYTEKFGWAPIPGSNGIVFFKMNGFIFALYPSADMVAGPGITQDGTGFKRVTFTIYYPSESEVDEVFKTLKARGVNIIKTPKKASWGGYIGYVADVEDNIWEIGYNPFVELDKDGNTIDHH